MSGIGDLWFSLRGDDRQLITDAHKAGDQAGTGFGAKFKASFTKQNIGKGLSEGLGLGGGLLAFQAVSTGLALVTKAATDSIEAASKLNESIGKSQVVFGDSSKEIEAWAATASTAFGQSKQQALEAAGTYGNLFQAFGVGQKEATKMSKSLVELAADLASFNNTSVDDALVALRSGLSGETEPLKRYGIAVSDARMRTELLAQGYRNLGTVLTPLQKSQAAYAIIMHDSSLAQGDFARTADGLANSQRTLDAKMADLSATIGGLLIPVAKSLVGILAATVDELTPLIALFDRAASSLDKFRAAALGAGADSDAARAFLAKLDDTAAQLGLTVDETFKLMQESGKNTVPELQAAMSAATDAYYRTQLKAHDLATETKDLVPTTETATKKIEVAYRTWAGKSTYELGRIYAAEKQVVDELQTLADTALSDYFDPIIEADRLAADEAELAAQRKIAASSKSSAAEKRDALSTIHTLEQSTTQSRIKLFEAGKLNSKEQGILLADLKRDWTSATGKAKAEIASLIAAIERLQGKSGVNINVSGGFGHKVPVRARGGPVWAGQDFLVGEAGLPEMLRMFPAGGGEVIPLAAGAAERHPAVPSHIGIDGTARVIHDLRIDPASAAALRAAGYNEERIARALVDATGLVTMLNQRTAMR